MINDKGIIVREGEREHRGESAAAAREKEKLPKSLLLLLAFGFSPPGHSKLYSRAAFNHIFSLSLSPGIAFFHPKGRAAARVQASEKRTL